MSDDARKASTEAEKRVEDIANDLIPVVSEYNLMQLECKTLAQVVPCYIHSSRAYFSQYLVTPIAFQSLNLSVHHDAY